MTENKFYKCVHCGEPADALYKRYGPSVLKLTKCSRCGRIVDKYVEYDSVIVMIDLILISREAHRHVLYNTGFQLYWKIFLILTLLETYGVWRNDSLTNIGITTYCNYQHFVTYSNHSSYKVSPLSSDWSSPCEFWMHQDTTSSLDLFILEKNFYIFFISTLIGLVVFLLTTHSLMWFITRKQTTVSVRTLIQSFTLADIGLLFTLPMLVWGGQDTSPETRAIHYLLVFLYSFVAFLNVFSVVFGCPAILTLAVLAVSHYLKLVTTFHSSPYIKDLIRQ